MRILFAPYTYSARSTIAKFMPSSRGNLRNSGVSLETLAIDLNVSQQVHYLGFVTTQELQSIFDAATAMIYPSKFEGFGLPIIEAFHARLPVLCSNASVLPEVAGDGALYFTPGCPKELAGLMLRILRDPELRRSLVGERCRCSVRLLGAEYGAELSTFVCPNSGTCHLMNASAPTTDGPSMECKICGTNSRYYGEALVLRKFQVSYFRCPACGFIQTETPYWLEEAYSSAIAKQDVGIMQRNLLNRELTTALINLLLPEVTTCVDYGAGHGTFVRLMRDRGFDFRWYDRHASNDYARGFEYQAGQPCGLLTAFEVLEHLTEPIADLATMMNIAENVFVSTLLIPEPAPKILDWWYFLPSTGQHISFYTRSSLELLAQRFGRHLLSRGPYHLFTSMPKSPGRFRLATDFRISRLLNMTKRRPSLIDQDFEEMIS